MADPIVAQQALLEHVKIEKTKPFAEVEAALDRALPQLDPAIRAAIANGDEHQAKEIERGTELYIFLKRDHGELLQITGRARKALQYEIGNPLTATKMTVRRPISTISLPGPQIKHSFAERFTFATEPFDGHSTARESP